MAKNNDNTILELTEKIEKKKSELGKKKRFSPITNCSLELNGNRLNINTMGEASLIQILVSVNALMTSAKELGVLDRYMLSGFSVSDWVSDIKERLGILEQEKELKRLGVMEKRLAKLLSEDKQVELEIDKMAKEI